MKTNTNHKAIIYDDNCPMCQAYTKAFVNTGFLRHENRIPFSKIKNKMLPGCTQKIEVDWQRARHEIPVIDKENGNVFYGIDALAELLQQKIFFTKPILNLPPIRWFFLNLYKFISYNRKIIVANYSPQKGEIDSSPDFNIKWRFLFIILSTLLTNVLVYNANFGVVNLQVFVAVSSLLIFITLLLNFFLKKIMKRNAVEIIAQVAIVSLIAAFFFRVSIFFKNIFLLPQAVFYVFILLTCVIIALQGVKRFRFLNIECHR